MGKPKGATSYRLSEATMADIERLSEAWRVSKASVLELGVAMLVKMLDDGPKSVAKLLQAEAAKRDG